jgi:DNA-binding response OmpR family regulator
VPTATKVLLIDDDSFYSEYVSLSLQLVGLEVTCAETAELGLELLVDNPNYDVAVIDGLLPGMNGIDLCKKIRQSSQLNKMKIIMASGLEQSQIDSKLQNCVFERYLKKPFSIDLLTLTIEELVRTA